MSDQDGSGLQRFLLASACVVIVVAGMRAAASILVPCLLALFVAVIVTPFFIGLQRRGLPSWTALLILILALAVLGAVGVVVVGHALSGLAQDLPSYQQQMQVLVDRITGWLAEHGVRGSGDNLLGSADPRLAIRLLSSTVSSMSSLVGNAFVIFLVVVFILLEAAILPAKVRAIPRRGEETMERLETMVENIRHYMGIKTVLSLLTGALVTVFLWILGVRNALVMGLLAFLLNYIPNVGSILAAIPAVLLALLQHGTGMALGVAGGYIAINVVVGNILEPRWMGRRLDLSPLVIVVTMLVWGWILGTVGMLLAVPLTMVVKIALESMEETRWIAVLMGGSTPTSPPEPSEGPSPAPGPTGAVTALLVALVLSTTASAQSAADLTPEEQDWIARTGSITLGADPAWPPFEYFDEENRYLGIASDVVSLLQSTLGLRMEVARGLSWSEVLEGARSGKLDALTCLIRTPERELFLEFTRAYCSVPLVVVMRQDAPFISSLRDYEKTGLTLAATRGYASLELLQRDYPDTEVRVVENAAEGLRAVSAGRLDGYLLNLATTSHMTRNLGLTNLKVAYTTDYTLDLRIGVPRGHPELLGILDKGLATITDDQKEEILHRWISLKIQPRTDYKAALQVLAIAAGVLAVVIYWNRRLAREIRARRRAEEALLLARDAAQSANRAKSEFLSNMSHELRTPLNGVLGYVQVLLRDAALTGRQRQNLEEIRSCGEHLLGLINDVLDLSKIEAGRLEVSPGPCDLPQLLRSVCDILRQRAQARGLELILDVEPQVPKGIETDGKMLRQVLVNLLGNAVKFTQQGRICLRVTEERGETLRLQVQDTGRGIPRASLRTIFDPFAQEEGGKTEGGTGLGLAISKRMVEALGGRLTVESEVGQGSTFSVFLPLVEVEDQDLGAVEAPALAGPEGDLVLAPGQDLLALIADDRQANRDVLAQLLQSAGFRTALARDGQEALDRMRSLLPDVVLMDIRMPGMDGVTAIGLIREDPQLKDTVVLAVSASVFPDSAARFQEAGFDAFLGKPLAARELFAALQRHLSVELQAPGPPPPAAAEAAPPASLDAAASRELGRRILAALEEGDLAALERIGEELESGGEPTRRHGARIRALAAACDLEGLERMIQEMDAAICSSSSGAKRTGG